MDLFYQQLLDLMAQHPANRDDFLPALELFTAIEAGDGPRISIAAANIHRMDIEFAPMVLLEEAVVNEALARLLLLGEEAAITRVIEWFAHRKTFARNAWDRHTELWKGAIERLPEPVEGLPPDQAHRVLKRVVSAFALLLKGHAASLSVEGVPPIYQGGMPADVGWGNAPWSPGRRTEVVADGIRRLAITWMSLHQQVLDAAMEALASGGPQRWEALLDLWKLWHLETRRSLDLPQFEKRAPWAGIRIPVTRIRPGQAAHHNYQDAFPRFASREFSFTPYDRDDDGEPSGKQVWLNDLFWSRRLQLMVPLDQFGAPYGFFPEPTTTIEKREQEEHFKKQEARRKVVERAEKSGGVLALGSEDDLARFACAFYKASLGGGTGSAASDAHEKAWSAVIEFLSKYLSQWTTQAEFNMDERRSYFDRLFPRSQAGGVVHDCGVYAVRMAYVFLSLAECAKPPQATGKSRVSFLLLPLHVGLLVEIAGFEPLVLHNQVMTRLKPDVVRAAEDEWKQSPMADDPSDPADLRQRLLEDIAAQLFLRDVDLPIRREILPNVGSPPSKTKIWHAYESLVVRKIAGLFADVVNQSGKPGYQFDTRFLEVLSTEKRWRDRVVVPFWNEFAPEQWRTLGKAFSNRVPLALALDNELDSISESYGL